MPEGLKAGETAFRFVLPSRDRMRLPPLRAVRDEPPSEDDVDEATLVSGKRPEPTLQDLMNDPLSWDEPFGFLFYFRPCPCPSIVLLRLDTLDTRRRPHRPRPRPDPELSCFCFCPSLGGAHYTYNPNSRKCYKVRACFHDVSWQPWQ